MFVLKFEPAKFECHTCSCVLFALYPERPRASYALCLTCSHALPASYHTWCCISRALFLCYTCVVPYVLMCFMCIMPYVLQCLMCFMPYVPSCLMCAVPYTPSAQHLFVTLVPHFCVSRDLHALCLRALMPHVPCALFVLMPHMPYVLFYLIYFVNCVVLCFSCLSPYVILCSPPLTCFRFFKYNMTICISHFIAFKS